jgi:hypothetical protein
MDCGSPRCGDTLGARVPGIEEHVLGVAKLRIKANKETDGQGNLCDSILGQG